MAVSSVKSNTYLPGANTGIGPARFLWALFKYTELFYAFRFLDGADDAQAETHHVDEREFLESGVDFFDMIAYTGYYNEDDVRS